MKKIPKNRGGITLFMIIQLFISTLFMETIEAGNFPVPPQATVSGTVTDTDGLPLAGVHVQVQSTKKGTVSDLDGTYIIEAGPNDTLVFSIVGFKRHEIPIASRQQLDIQLEVDVTQLGEVILNAGYYTVTEQESTGSIEKVTAVDIEKQPISNPLAALQGRMAGVDIVQQTGIPGGNFKVQIRGMNSVRLYDATANDPLYIVDGIPLSSASLDADIPSAEILGQGVSPLGGINPNNIESIEVLKDADATAIYGSRGSNGVVLITTKKGKKGKTMVEVDLSTGLGVVPKKVDMMNTEQYLEMRREAFANDSREPGNTDYDLNGTWDETRYTDWQDLLIGGTAYITNAQVSISGGSSQTSFLFGGAHQTESTVFIGNYGYNRNTAHLNLNHQSIDGLFQLNGSINYADIKNDLPGRDVTSVSISLPPNAPRLFDTDGNLNWENSTWTNPLSYLEMGYSSNIQQLFTNFSMSYKILSKLNIKVNSGYSRTTSKEIKTMPKSYADPANSGQAINHAYFSNGDLISWIVEPQIQYNTSFGNGNLDILIGSSFQHQEGERISQMAIGFTSEALIKDIGSAPIVDILSNSYNVYRYHAIFGRINYNLKGRYILNLTGRRDASSRFGPGKQWGNFGAIGLAWLFGEENLIKNHIKFLSFGKFKLSYGTTGNDKIGDYGYLDTYSSTGSYQGHGGLAPVRLFSPDFGWEVNKKAELGFDLGLFDNTLSISAGYYHNISTNQLVGMPLPPSTGFTSVQNNLPAKVRNTGLEFAVNSRIISTDQFSWNTGFNLTVPQSKLLAFPSLEGSTYERLYQVGKPIQIRKVFHFLGIDSETGEYRFEDLNGDGNLNGDDQFAINTGLDYFGGLSNLFRYKGMQLDIHVQFVKQYGTSLTNSLGVPAGFKTNQPVTVMDRWQIPGDNTAYQRFTSTYTQTAQAYSRWNSSDASSNDASYMRLKNISLTYQFPNEVARKLKMSGIQCFLRGHNLVTITNFDGLDPENYRNGRILPPLRTITTGVQFSF